MSECAENESQLVPSLPDFQTSAGRAARRAFSVSAENQRLPHEQGVRLGNVPHSLGIDSHRYQRMDAGVEPIEIEVSFRALSRCDFHGADAEGEALRRETIPDGEFDGDRLARVVQDQFLSPTEAGRRLDSAPSG